MKGDKKPPVKDVYENLTFKETISFLSKDSSEEKKMLILSAMSGKIKLSVERMKQHQEEWKKIGNSLTTMIAVVEYSTGNSNENKGFFRDPPPPTNRGYYRTPPPPTKESVLITIEENTPEDLVKIRTPRGGLFYYQTVYHQGVLEKFLTKIKNHPDFIDILHELAGFYFVALKTYELSTAKILFENGICASDLLKDDLKVMHDSPLLPILEKKQPDLIKLALSYCKGPIDYSKLFVGNEKKNIVEKNLLEFILSYELADKELAGLKKLEIAEVNELLDAQKALAYQISILDKILFEPDYLKNPAPKEDTELDISNFDLEYTTAELKLQTLEQEPLMGLLEKLKTTSTEGLVSFIENCPHHLVAILQVQQEIKLILKKLNLQEVSEAAAEVEFLQMEFILERKEKILTYDDLIPDLAPNEEEEGETEISGNEAELEMH